MSLTYCVRRSALSDFTNALPVADSWLGFFMAYNGGGRFWVRLTLAAMSAALLLLPSHGMTGSRSSSELIPIMAAAGWSG